MTGPDHRSVGSVAELVYQLKLMFTASRLSYDRMAAKSGLSSATVHAMVNKPDSLPRAASIEAFVIACGHPAQPWLSVRDDLARIQVRPVRASVADLRAELASAHERIVELERLLEEFRVGRPEAEPGDHVKSLARKPAGSEREQPVHAVPAVKAPKYLTAQEIFCYPLDGVEDRSICIITGNLNRVMNIDVWVNPENTHMRMSERYHQSISGMIRLYGAERDIGGHIIRDLIADELSEKVAGRTPVQPAVAISTGPGRLSLSNNVKAIVHVAAVQIEEGMGRRQLQEIDICTFNVLHEVERLAVELDQPARSVIFPLLGTGSGRGDRESTAQVMVDSAVTYLRQKRSSHLRRIYFSARTSLTLEALESAAAESFGLRARSAAQ